MADKTTPKYNSSVFFVSDIEKSKKDAEKVEQEDLKSSRDSFKIALQEELNAEKENLINKVITQEEYDLRVFEAEQAHLENMKNLNIAYGEDVAAMQEKIIEESCKTPSRLIFSTFPI